MTHTLAEGCCSARTPCAHQCKDPTTICHTCRAASPSVAAWLEEQEAAARGRADDCRPASDKEHWHRAQAAAYEAAHAYAVAKPDRAVAPTLKPHALAVFLREKRDEAMKLADRFEVGSFNHGMNVAQASAYAEAASAADNLERGASTHARPVALSVLTSDADLAYLAGLAISSKDATLARIAAALLLAR